MVDSTANSTEKINIPNENKSAGLGISGLGQIPNTPKSPVKRPVSQVKKPGATVSSSVQTATLRPKVEVASPASASTQNTQAKQTPVNPIIAKRKNLLKLGGIGSLDRKKKMIIGGLAGVLILILGFLIYDLNFKNIDWLSPLGSKGSAEYVDPYGIDPANRFENPINGWYVTKDYAKNFQDLKPIAVMVNNYDIARPHAGLSQADIVYEVVAESGITRLMPIYFSRIPEKVGSIRSARYYFVELASAYHAHFLHWGAAYVPACQKAPKDSPSYCPPVNGMVETVPDTDAYDRIVQLGSPNLDGGNYACNTDNCAFTRDSDLVGKVPTEHTAVVRLPLIYELARRVRTDDAWHRYTEIKPEWKFKDDAQLEDRGNIGATSPIVYNYSSTRPQFEVKWEYDREKNEYVRYQGGEKQIDRLDGSELRAKTVIIRFTEQRPANDQKNHLYHTIVGSGDAIIFQDGNVIEGRWTRVTHKERDVYWNASGEQVELVRGQIWVQLVPVGQNVSYSGISADVVN